MRKTASLLAWTVLLSSCGSGADIDRAVALAIRGGLVPADSAFRDFQRVGAHCFIGELSPTNRDGVYTGYRPFIAEIKSGKLAISPKKLGVDQAAAAKIVEMAKACELQAGEDPAWIAQARAVFAKSKGAS